MQQRRKRRGSLRKRGIRGVRKGEDKRDVKGKQCETDKVGEKIIRGGKGSNKEKKYQNKKKQE